MCELTVLCFYVCKPACLVLSVEGPLGRSDGIGITESAWKPGNVWIQKAEERNYSHTQKHTHTQGQMHGQGHIHAPIYTQTHACMRTQRHTQSHTLEVRCASQNSHLLNQQSRLVLMRNNEPSRK